MTISQFEMRSKLRMRWVIASAAVLSVFMFACATSQSGMHAEDEAAFSTAGEQSDESDDLASILGLTPAEQVKEARSEPKSSAAPENGRKLELEKSLSEKDLELRRLREELQTKESLIKARERNLTESLDTPAAPLSAAAFRNRYDEALRLYHARRYSEAAAAFDELIRLGGDPSLVDNCQYWKGECYYGLRDYQQAIIEFQKVFNYPSSNKLDDAQLKLGLCYVRLGNMERARQEFRKLIDNYPNSEYIERARSYLQ